ncbi:MAG: SDR family oxidoreductase [Catenulispora sp.]|nr:SDR family oxidoreductase [Catenulispora sp.]
MNENEHVVVIGASSGMGLALAERLLSQGSATSIVGRNAERLATAKKQLTESVSESDTDLLRTHAADIANEDDVRALFTATGPVDHVVVTAADAAGAYQPIRDFDLKPARALVDTKLFGAILTAKHAAIRPGGSLTFVSGIAAYRPLPGGSIVAAANGALASLTAALALELAPVRVNTVSPGWVDTPIWDAIAGEAKHDRLAAMAARLPVGRVGAPQDIADALLLMMRNPFVTGTVLHVDGGHRLV